MTIIYQRHRTYSLIVGDIKTGEGFEISNDLNISFDCTKTSSNKDKSNSCVIDVYNLSKEKQKWLEKPYIGVVLSVGYHDTTIKRLFSGQATSVSTTKSGTDTVTQITIGDAYVPLNHQTVTKVIPEGKTVGDCYKELGKIMGVDQTVLNGQNINTELLDGYPISGTCRQTFDELSNAYNVDWNVDGNVLRAYDADGTSTDDLNTAFVISRSTGMINLPYHISGDVRRTEKDKAKKEGVQVQILLNPELSPGSIVKIEDENFEGYYKISSLRSYGEWRGSPWYTDLRLEKKIKV
ncbi:hypothetical protein D3C85_776760 [compost metagenome]